MVLIRVERRHGGRDKRRTSVFDITSCRRPGCLWAKSGSRCWGVSVYSSQSHPVSFPRPHNITSGLLFISPADLRIEGRQYRLDSHTLVVQSSSVIPLVSRDDTPHFASHILHQSPKITLAYCHASHTCPNRLFCRSVPSTLPHPVPSLTTHRYQRRDRQI